MLMKTKSLSNADAKEAAIFPAPAILPALAMIAAMLLKAWIRDRPGLVQQFLHLGLHFHFEFDDSFAHPPGVACLGRGGEIGAVPGDGGQFTATLCIFGLGAAEQRFRRIRSRRFLEEGSNKPLETGYGGRLEHAQVRKGQVEVFAEYRDFGAAPLEEGKTGAQSPQVADAIVRYVKKAARRGQDE